MSAPLDDAVPATRTKPGRVFRKSRPPMPRLDAARQARVMSLAWTALGDRDRVMAFLNADHPQLGARPLDLAIASDVGLARVERALADLATGAQA
ncbi:MULTISPECIES: antitoxin Xre/MbcA/ParS toxin-binding domain-containing protein [unclassified Sphingomonas]|uniref:antitoxin Xre/MbcA/ParS toxin-binding domain-containing protein n=1 Tax=unclassified Sphingomonas TaxID=196159 RepID=UPI0025F2DC10|nr:MULTISPECIES: antitoxin Xre/MbcA/ParS toxin-binding domain-containing protein [unclassified Sphingomonas]